ncbi:hypothetical protein MTO96_019130 [Rhipicephalus appendiculatus]
MAGFDDVGIGDFVLLENITTDAFLDNLKVRYNAGRVYTYIGEVCVSVNPYRTLNIYGPDQVADYKGREIFERPPARVRHRRRRLQGDEAQVSRHLHRHLW